MVAMQCFALSQTPTFPQVQALPVRNRCCAPTGAHRAGELGPNSASVGTPSPAAKCSGPVSPENENLGSREHREI